MKAVLFGALVGSVGATDLGAKWAEFKTTHKRGYSAAEEEARFGYFKENMARAAESQARNPMATFGSNKFSDLSKEEFTSYHNLRLSDRVRSPINPFSAAQIAAKPTSVDWRQHGAVTPVKDQGQCGSCWAFSSTGGIEGQWFMAGNKIPVLSEQHLVSCDKTDDGCNGGLQDDAFTWLVKHNKGAITTEAAYPYKSGNGKSLSCKYEKSMPTGAVVTGHKDLQANEDVMATWIAANGPLPVAVDAGNDWQSYTSGILTGCRAGQLDHAVLAVGYTSKYWIVKNSWAADWGEKGYIRLAYGSDQCGVKKDPNVPFVQSSTNATRRVFEWQTNSTV